MRTPENITAVTESVRETPSTSNHDFSQQLNNSETSLRRILHKDLGMTPYNVQLVQDLKPIDYPIRFHFAKRACDRLTEESGFGKKKLIFSDEAQRVCKQNCRIWGAEKPHAYTVMPTRPKRVSV